VNVERGQRRTHRLHCGQDLCGQANTEHAQHSVSDVT
jgi:hypothetical protein